MIRLLRQIIAIGVALFSLLVCIAAWATPNIETSARWIVFLIVAFVGYGVFRLFWPGARPAPVAPAAPIPSEPHKFSWEYQGKTRSITTAETSPPRVEPPRRTQGNTKTFDKSTPRGAFPEYWIEYSDINGEVTEREVWIVAIDLDDPDLVKAWCFDRNDVRTFRSSRVLDAKYLPTGQRVRSLARHYLEHG